MNKIDIVAIRERVDVNNIQTMTFVIHIYFTYTIINIYRSFVTNVTAAFITKLELFINQIFQQISR